MVSKNKYKTFKKNCFVSKNKLFVLWKFKGLNPFVSDFEKKI